MYTKLNIKLKYPLYSFVSALVSSTQFLIAGGMNQNQELIDEVYLINFTKEDSYINLEPLPFKLWSINQAIYNNNTSTLEIFPFEQFPNNIISYLIKFPIN